MAIERFINNFQTTLSSGIDGSTTSIPVNAATSVAAQFRAKIDNEIIIITANGNTTTWTATRGAEGTSNVSHSSGATVTVVVTAGAMQQMIADQVRTGAYDNLPATSDALEGHIYIPNDSVYDKLVFNGSSWDRYIQGRLVDEIPTTGWSATYGTATDTAPFTPTIADGYITLDLAASAGNFIHIYRRNVPSDPTVTPYFLEIGITIPWGVIIVGAAFFDDTGGDDGTIVAYNTTGGAREVFTAVYDLPSAALITNLGQISTIHGNKAYFGLEEDNTNRKTYYGASPESLIQTSTQTRTTTYTATDVCIVLYTNNSAIAHKIVLHHWKVR